MKLYILFQKQHILGLNENKYINSFNITLSVIQLNYIENIPNIE